MREIKLKVVVDEAHVGQTDVVCRAVARAGMRVEQVIAEAGTIFGTADESVVTLISHAEGVLWAAPEEGYCVPPRDAPQ